ncbi:hypothetical protein SERLA73DRAFT_178615 [Serpula lacrymans var. lacrymans S7.3]|uniref:Uncharacterized protein n=1 Tax=Serpula lacrymans var. lacrymans (strain S7.3) TaxID=936435 RepID=F8PSA1_SERL3|nr:hypothetical protein SERLA73DRAFT_178615 [Serpula lacrymans var. lacrymans S7.3]
MYPIPTHTVNLILQYICPPSQLDQPLPPHLISKSLLQRHHFLSIFPNDSLEYLCWPSSQSSKAVELLESFVAVKRDWDVEGDEFAVRYTSDREHTCAHVRVTTGEGLDDDDTGARLVFQWDDVDGWKYHDLQLMPFPPASHATLGEASSTASSIQVPYDSKLNGTERSREFDVAKDADGTEDDDDDDDDSYWNAYGAHEDSSPSALLGSAVNSKTSGSGEGAEDAYWAQYASVQGTGDSTLPSPLPVKKHRFAASQEEPIAIPLSAIHSRSRFTHLGPPSPNTLTDLLNVISPRRDEFPSPLSDPEESETASDTPSPFSALDQPETITPLSAADSDQYADVSMVSRRGASVNGTAHSTVGLGEGLRIITGDNEEDDGILRDAVKGIHSLWKAGRRKQSAVRSQSDEDAHFLRVVREAIGQS